MKDLPNAVPKRIKKELRSWDITEHSEGHDIAVLFRRTFQLPTMYTLQNSSDLLRKFLVA